MSSIKSSVASSSQYPITSEQPTPDPGNKPASRGQGTLGHKGLVSILVLGRSGAGKSYSIDHACTRSSERTDNLPPHAKTMDVSSKRVTLSGVKFKLIDTPGFDNLALSDIDVFTKIITYLLRLPAANQRVHGIIYVHRAGDTLQSRALLRTMTILSNLFIGEDNFSRLAIFVSQINARRMDPKVITDELRRPGSVFGAACARGAQVVTPSSDRPAFIKTIMSYASRDPVTLPIYDYALHNSPLETVAHFKDNMWYFEEESAHQRLKDLERRYESELDKLRLQLDDKERQHNQSSATYDQAEKPRIGLHETEVPLRQQFRQVHSEPASPRSQPQNQDNPELRKIVQELKDLNRGIEDISRQIAQDLIDNFVYAVLKKDPADVTALDAYDLSGLKEWFEHTDGKPSLFASSKGVGVYAEDLLDLTIRILLCTFLITKIFRPFHPAIDSSQSSALLVAYETLQKQEPQSVTGKWRSSTFKAIYKPESSESTVDFVDALTHKFLSGYLIPFTSMLLGPNATLQTNHVDHLHGLITRAWDWNLKLQSEDFLLGDFTQIAHIAGLTFDSERMSEFEASSRNPQAKVILGTIALGLIRQRALGGDQPPQEDIIVKPVVITENFHNWSLPEVPP